MIDCTSFKGKKIGVLGLGKSGKSTAVALKASGVDVVAWDDNNLEKFDDIKRVDLNTYDLSVLDMLVISPGIPHTLPMAHPIIDKAKNAGVEIVNDVHIFKESYNNDIIAVTGTNGKSTTTALINHLLNGSQMGGNIGTPLMSLNNDCEVTVAELSSYQTEITSNLNAKGVVWLNITPDHIERHGDMNGYVKAKVRIFETQNNGGVAVICIDDEYSMAVYNEIKAQGKWHIIPVSTKNILDKGVSIIEGEIFDHNVNVGSMHEATRLKGEHNHQNAACAYAIAKYIYKLKTEDILNKFASFLGLEHRQYQVRALGDVEYINDSKATNAEATEKAIVSYENIYWLVGGVAKEGGIASLQPHLNRIKKAYLYGKSAPEFAKFLERQNTSFEVYEDMSKALDAAHKDAQVSENKSTVLLSPACASFDMYPNFEKRGEHFEVLVRNLTK